MSLGQRKQNTITVNNGVIQTRCRYSNTDTTTNINTNTAFGTRYAPTVGTEEKADGDFTKIDSETIRVNFTGRVMAIANLYFTSAGARVGLAAQWEVEGTATGCICGNSYIRNTASLNDSGINFVEEFDVIDQDEIKLSIRREGSTSTSTTLNAAGSCSVMLIKVE